jgi:imidazolonepropionase-like amidohydrolase
MRIRARQIALSICTALLAATQAQAAPQVPPAGAVLITADRVWTGDGAPHAGWSVLVAQGRIQAVGPTDKMSVPADAERISLPGRTLIPGLIDLHSHVLLHPYN